MKYTCFIEQYPDLPSISQAPLKDVLEAWQGLGYNRRAINLRLTGKTVMSEYNGLLPETGEELESLPGIGKATAGALQAFAFNKPAVFIETNIRRVFIHFFFRNKTEVKDAEIMPVIEKTLDRDDPRAWYYALMDYGSMLKNTIPNPNRKSKGYVRQPAFPGSDRQLRGAVIRKMLAEGTMEVRELISCLTVEPGRAEKIISVLEQEGFLACADSLVSIR